MASLNSSLIEKPAQSMSIETRAALDRLLRRYVENCQRVSGSLPSQEHDPAWPSKCQVGDPDAVGMIRWRPQKRGTAANFSGLECALEVEIHPDIKSFYGSYWGSAMKLTAVEGGLTLIQIWNDDDFERLVENLIGHAMAKQRIKAPLTIFIACADEGDLMLSVDNETGRVVHAQHGSAAGGAHRRRRSSHDSVGMASLNSSLIEKPAQSMSIETRAALDRLLRRYVENCQRVSGSLPSQEHDPAWPSKCQVGDPDAVGMIRWRPQKRGTAANFSGLECALEVEIHPDIKSFYGSYWGSAMKLTAVEGGLTLIQIWNDDDFERLVENLIGHAMAKQRIKAPLTIFIACADEGDLMLSVDNETGRVVLEDPGGPPIREVSPSVAEFLDRLHPAPESDR